MKLIRVSDETFEKIIKIIPENEDVFEVLSDSLCKSNLKYSYFEEFKGIDLFVLSESQYDAKDLFYKLAEARAKVLLEEKQEQFIKDGLYNFFKKQ